MPQLTWLITGCSSGLGEHFVHQLLGRGDRVIATARNGASRLTSLKEAGAAILDLDVTAPQGELDGKIQEAIAIYGIIDVLVNNAGYIEAGMVEEAVLFQLGFFRTKVMDSGNVKAEAPSIDDYKELNTVVADFAGGMNGDQPGDPEKSVNIMIDVVKGEGVAAGKPMPERLPLGPDVLAKIRDKYTAYLEICKEWKIVIVSTDIKK
ncbi:hypothetical protein MMC27_008793 [Xylographa pallens]|nr:hypothetical protein [Xylographa pallens]